MGTPKRPEVFLDESYVNEHHVGSRTWLLEDRVRYTKSGNGRRYCIIGAGIVHVENGGLHAEWVEGALHYWQADLAPRADQDYHGNFDSPKFEKWFGELCQTLQHKYGPCHSIMDGASYHKRIVLPTPKKSTSRKSIIAWLLKKGIPWESSMKKKGLLRLVKASHPKVNYVANRIAQQHGHFLYYTPPYHPELQPIEVVWGTVKNRIANAPAKSMADLGNKLGASLDKVTEHTWLGAFRKVQKFEDTYFQIAEEHRAQRESAAAAEKTAADAAVAAALNLPLGTHERIFQF
jgi:transposase